MNEALDTEQSPAAAVSELDQCLTDAMAHVNARALDAAVAACRAATERFPDAPEPFYVMAVIAWLMNDQGEAASFAETAHRMDPDTCEYAELLASILTRVGRLTDGVYYAKLAAMGEPHPFLKSKLPAGFLDFESAVKAARHSMHYVNAARAFNIANYDLAFRECQAELKINREHADAFILLGRVALLLGRTKIAIGSLQAAVRLRPDDALVKGLLARALVMAGRYGEAAALARQAIEACGADAEAYAQAMHALLSCPDTDIADAQRLALAFQAAFDQENPPPADDALDNDATRPVIVGFLSNAFHRSGLADFFQPWFQLKARRGIQYNGYQQSVVKDAVTSTIKNGCVGWREVVDIDPYTLQMTLKAEELDGLVDLSSPDYFTRFTVMGLRPAKFRVGVTSLPEPGFAPGITHVLSDETLAEADRAALLPGQELLSVPGTLFARPPIDSLAQDSPTPAADTGIVTFGAVASHPRLSPAAALMWAEVLKAVPRARLLLLGCADVAADERARILECFMHGGVAQRVQFILGEEAEDGELTGAEGEDAPAAPVSAFGAIVPSSHWRVIDVFLDSSPICSGVELTEALWSGVPAVTLMGPRRLARVGASILMAAGRRNWIAASPAAYVETAQYLASDIGRLGAERRGLQAAIAATPLFMPGVTAENVRTALLQAGLAMRQSTKRG
jgi:protein O-GlcNAc transferase